MPESRFTPHTPPIRCSRLSVAALTMSQNLRGLDSTPALSHGQPWEAAAPGGQGKLVPFCPCVLGAALPEWSEATTPALHTLGWLQLGLALAGRALFSEGTLWTIHVHFHSHPGQNRVTRPPQQW